MDTGQVQRLGSFYIKPFACQVSHSTEGKINQLTSSLRTKLDTFWTFPGSIGAAISPYVGVPSAQAQTITATFIWKVTIQSAAHANIITSVAWRIDIWCKKEINIGAIG